ncbi:Na+/H+ antiporter NhaA [Congregibacter litoralis]|uniref:Na(+)/H(+) antiporter NhaA n=1 Tax=Congregibacter litoralis KT71 TaxID=314285 RepID=A4ACE7_9GAMM|nr:Na+/H+ antiporter NhaA [Congregibacter litoralis]EAQ96375.1 sodium/proton antiporter, NhaA family [Congregibacter litoralis KT71]
MSSDDQLREKAPLEKPAEKLLAPLSQFVRSQAASGILLAIAVVLAMVMANNGFHELYETIKHLHFSISLGSTAVDMSLKHWVNDGLMVLFFFLLGLEIKRELIAGELRDVRKSSLVFFMAAGGMILPALVYLAVNGVTDAGAARGWGIPMATDTAFALGILAAMGSRVPRVAIVLLSALAILDDIGAVMVISLFYTDEVLLAPLFRAVFVLFLLLVLNLSGFRRPLPYGLLGVALWWFVLQSGVHATTAGILAAMAVPARPYGSTTWFLEKMEDIVKRFRKTHDPDQSVLEKDEHEELAEEARKVARATLTPLQRWERAMDIPVSLLIVPLFAFLNAGVLLPDDIGYLFTAPVPLAAALGLTVGKAVGISAFAWLGLKLGVARMPEELVFGHLVGLAFLAGIGFTMSLFVNSLAFEDAVSLQEDAKLGILMGSLTAAILGTSILLWLHRRGDSNDD